MSDTFETFDDRDFLAADYALGTLSAAERVAAERRMRRDAAFRAEVESWQARLAPMLLTAPSEAPSLAVWNAVEAGLPRPVAGPASAAAQPSLARKLVPAFWRWLAIGASGLAAASIATLVLLFQPGTQMPPGSLGLVHTASITSDSDGTPVFAVVLDPATDTATLVPIQLEPSAGQVPELWIARDGGAPRSLGTFDPAQPLRLTIEGEAIEGDLSNSVLAISLEPEGGSPTGQPTGPVVGHGQLNAI